MAKMSSPENLCLEIDRLNHHIDSLVCIIAELARKEKERIQTKDQNVLRLQKKIVTLLTSGNPELLESRIAMLLREEL